MPPCCFPAQEPPKSRILFIILGDQSLLDLNYDIVNDPKQYDNLFYKSEYAEVLSDMKAKLKDKLTEIGKNDLNFNKL